MRVQLLHLFDAVHTQTKHIISALAIAESMTACVSTAIVRHACHICIIGGNTFIHWRQVRTNKHLEIKCVQSFHDHAPRDRIHERYKQHEAKMGGHSGSEGTEAWHRHRKLWRKGCKRRKESPRKKKGHFALQLCFRKSRKRKMGVFYGKVAKSSTFFGISNSPPNSVSQLCSFLGLWSGFLNVQGTILCREQKSVVNRFVSKLLWTFTTFPSQGTWRG